MENLSTYSILRILISSIFWASLVAEMVKNPPAMRETWAWSLGWEDPLEKGTATHSNILIWRIPWTEELSRQQSMGSQRVGQEWATSKKKKESQIEVYFQVLDAFYYILKHYLKIKNLEMWWIIWLDFLISLHICISGMYPFGLWSIYLLIYF